MDNYLLFSILFYQRSIFQLNNCKDCFPLFCFILFYFILFYFLFIYIFIYILENAGKVDGWPRTRKSPANLAGWNTVKSRSVSLSPLQLEARMKTK
ncbi:hypothetical protein I7I50_09817 [Histoplasma capsulatum G186AR]|uniref:Uncharacterized protein n=1 Tax=Ajellomyces capsulatus TaxID=5037 RepID=A0A8H7YXH6_AJECA|nr:hypothetical protein I7I52_10866 [Histoplasma capsulatum]QSS68747.1 hypothetical protein I7I50_09817 [Histoplasma capsulatum G186AR]